MHPPKISFSILRTIKSHLKNLRKTSTEVYKNNLQNNNGLPKYSIVSPEVVGSSRTVPNSLVKPHYVESGSIVPVLKMEIKNAVQIQGMRNVCCIARKILDTTAKQLKVGMTTDKVDEIAHELCIEHKVYPSPLKYRGFPKSVCTSVNNVCCHGIPDSRKLQDGDIMNIDVTVFHNGFHGDLSETYLIGDVDEDGKKLVDVARECRDAGIAVCRDGARFCDIGNKISSVAEKYGYSVIPEFLGHGIGSYFHGPPEIIHVAYEDNEAMKAGMTFTVEPIISEGIPDMTVLDDGWTAVSVDGSRSAQFEHTVLVTDSGVEILTK